MKQKYTVVRDDEKQVLTISEYAELDKDAMSLLCEQTYPEDRLKAAMEKGPQPLATTLRTINLYPPVMYIQRIADAVINLYREEAEETSVDLVFDDMNYLFREDQYPTEAEEIDDGEEDIDELLDDDDIEDEFENDDTIDPVNSPIKIADDDSLDMEDEG